MYHRVLVPIERPVSERPLEVAGSICDPLSGRIRLVHVRIFDSPGGELERFFAESFEEATAVVEDARGIPVTWDVEVTGVVIEAERSRVAAAILKEAAAWGSDVIVVTQRRRRAFSLSPLGSLNRQLMTRATCPVLLVHRRRP